MRIKIGGFNQALEWKSPIYYIHKSFPNIQFPFLILDVCKPNTSMEFACMSSSNNANTFAIIDWLNPTSTEKAVTPT